MKLDANEKMKYAPDERSIQKTPLAAAPRKDKNEEASN